MLLDHGMWHLSYNMNDMMLYGGIHQQSIDWIHSFIALDLYCAAEATHQGPNGSFPSPRQQGTWCCLHIPLCEEDQRGKIWGYLQGELEEEEVHTCHAICINESIFHHMLKTPYLPHRHCCRWSWISWTLVSRQLQSALCNGDQSSAIERMTSRRNKHMVVSGITLGCMPET